MHKILFRGKRFNSVSYVTYEQARSRVRKFIRLKFAVSGNPNITEFGFSIKSI